MAVIAGIFIWEMHQQDRAFRESAYYSGHPLYPEYHSQPINESAGGDTDDETQTT